MLRTHDVADCNGLYPGAHPMSIPRLALAAALTIALAACDRSAPEAPAKPAARPAKSHAAPLITGPTPVPYVEPMVGGAKMLLGQDILSNLRKSADHTMFIKAVDTAGLEDIFRGKDMLTVFAPTNKAFQQMPGGLDALLKPEQRDKLIALVSYHIVPGKLDADAMAQRVMAGNGKASLPTAQGGSLVATVGNGAALIQDGKGASARITTPDVRQSNGVVYVIDTVLRP